MKTIFTATLFALSALVASVALATRGSADNLLAGSDSPACCSGSCWADGCCGTDRCTTGTPPRPVFSKSCDTMTVVGVGHYGYEITWGMVDTSRMEAEAELSADREASSLCKGKARRIGMYHRSPAPLRYGERARVSYAVAAPYCCD